MDAQALAGKVVSDVNPEDIFLYHGHLRDVPLSYVSSMKVRITHFLIMLRLLFLTPLISHSLFPFQCLQALALWAKTSPVVIAGDGTSREKLKRLRTVIQTSSRH